MNRRMFFRTLPAAPFAIVSPAKSATEAIELPPANERNGKRMVRLIVDIARKAGVKVITKEPEFKEPP